MSPSMLRLLESILLLRWMVIAPLCIMLIGCTPYPMGSTTKGHSPLPGAESSEPFSLRGLPSSVAIIWQDSIVAEYDAKMSSVLIQHGFRVAERKHLDKVLEEIKFQQSGLTDESARKIAAFLNVDSILIAERKLIAYRIIDGFGYYANVICKLVTLPGGMIVYADVDCMLRFPTRNLPPK